MSSQSGLRTGLVLIAAICIIAGCCRGSGPEVASPQAAPDTTVSDTVATHTSDRDSSSAEADTVTHPDPVPPGPAPGTVRIRASVASCDTSMTPVHCRLQIEEVLAYGSSTPPIGTGERTVRFAASLLSDRAVDDLIGHPHVYVLRHVGIQPVSGDEGEKTKQTEWSARSIETNGR